MHRSFILILAISCIAIQTHAQDSTSNAIQIAVPSRGFLYNNEFASPLQKGYTLPGIYTNPQLAVKNDKWKLAGGLHLLKYSGEGIWNKTRPFLQLQYKPSARLAIILGRLQARDNHKLPDVLYHKERRITRQVQEGVQFRWEGNHTFADLWIDWEHFISAGDSAQERFVVGSANTFRLPGSLQLILRGLAVHRGGEINKGDSRVQTLLNGQVGFLWEAWKKPQKSVTIHISSFGFYNASPKVKLPHKKGYLLQAGSRFRYRKWHFSANYLQGRDFISVRGNPLYQSVSQAYPGRMLSQRQLVHGKMMYSIRLGDKLRFYLGGEVWQHLQLQELDYRYWFSLSIKPQWEQITNWN